MRFGTLLTTAIVGAALSFGATDSRVPVPPDRAMLEKNVGQAIGTLAWYGVFDELNYAVDVNGVVTLSGQVARPVVRRDALAAVKNLPGVREVRDEIEVLPLSRYDDDIRVRAYYAIFGYPALNRYVINARPPIRILVKNGNITLAGQVTTEADKQIAEARVRTLPFAFQVTNELQVP